MTKTEVDTLFKQLDESLEALEQFSRENVEIDSIIAASLEKLRSTLAALKSGDINLMNDALYRVGNQLISRVNAHAEFTLKTASETNVAWLVHYSRMRDVLITEAVHTLTMALFEALKSACHQNERRIPSAKRYLAATEKLIDSAGAITVLSKPDPADLP